MKIYKNNCWKRVKISCKSLHRIRSAVNESKMHITSGNRYRGETKIYDDVTSYRYRYRCNKTLFKLLYSKELMTHCLKVALVFSVNVENPF